MDIALLGVQVQSTGAKEASKDLVLLAESAVRAENASAKLALSSDNLRGANGRFVSANNLAKESLERSVDSTNAYSNSIEQLRSKYVPLFAITKNYEAAVREVSIAEKSGALSADEATAARTRLSAGMLDSTNRIRAGGREMQNYGMHSANVFAQLNDIGVMMASGQNPFTLALQQGTQLNQVWGQMGGKVSSVGSVLRGAFMSLLNPLNLATIGVIAFGSMAVQWLFSAGEEAKTFEDLLGDLSSATDHLSKVTDMTLEQMIDKYGELTESIKMAITEQQNLALGDVNARANDAVSALSSEVDGSIASIVNLQDQIAYLKSLSIEDAMSLGNVPEMILQANEAIGVFEDAISLSAAEATKLDDALSLYRSAQTLTDRADAAGAITAALRGTSLEASEFARNVNNSQLELYAAAKAADDLAASGPGSDWMNPGIAATDALIARLGVAVAMASQIDSGVYGVVGARGNPMDQGANAGQSNTFNSENFTMPTDVDTSGDLGGLSGGGGSGGGGTDPYQSSLDRLIQSLMTEREVVETWYAESETLLNDRRAMEMLGAVEHKEAMLALEREYQEKISRVQDDSANLTLGSAASMFGELYSLSNSSMDGLLMAQKAFAQAQMIYDQAKGISAILGDATVPLFAKGFAIAKLAATFAGLRNMIGVGSNTQAAINSTPTGSSSSAATAPVKVMKVEFVGSEFMVDLAEQLFDPFYEASKNGVMFVK